MSSHKGKVNGDEEYIRAFSDQMADLAAIPGLHIKCELRGTARKAVICPYFLAWQVRQDGTERLVVGYGAEWPTSRVLSLPACLYQASVRFARMVEEWEDERKMIAAYVEETGLSPR